MAITPQGTTCGVVAVGVVSSRGGLGLGPGGAEIVSSRVFLCWCFGEVGVWEGLVCSRGLGPVLSGMGVWRVLGVSKLESYYSLSFSL